MVGSGEALSRRRGYSAAALAGFLVVATIGIAAGLGSYTFFYAKGDSYLSDDPAACANCHVMQAQYAGWLRSSHRQVAVCNDCHTPADFLGKYLTKSLNGWHHSSAFTTGDFPDEIVITARNAQIAEQKCRHCHRDMVDAVDGVQHRDSPLACVGCHRNVGHAH